MRHSCLVALTLWVRGAPLPRVLPHCSTPWLAASPNTNQSLAGALDASSGAGGGGGGQWDRASLPFATCDCIADKGGKAGREGGRSPRTTGAPITMHILPTACQPGCVVHPSSPMMTGARVRGGSGPCPTPSIAGVVASHHSSAYRRIPPPLYHAPSAFRMAAPSCYRRASLGRRCSLPWLRLGVHGRWALSSYSRHPCFTFFCFLCSLFLMAICPLLATSHIPAPSLPCPLTSPCPRAGFVRCVALCRRFLAVRRLQQHPRAQGAPVVRCGSLGRGGPVCHVARVANSHLIGRLPAL